MSLVLEKLGKTYGSRVALHPADLEVRPGEVCELTGPNGSGKSTLLALISGLRVPSTGTARIDGVSTRDPRGRAGLGVLPERPALPRHHSLAALLRALGREPGDLPQRLGVAMDRRLGTLSAGQAQRAAILLALAGSPRWLLLDEPLSALDREAIPAVFEAVAERVRAGAGVLLATHRPEVWSPLVSRRARLQGGHLAEIA
ncbi:MAG: ATP-binding cassette domain-containing protein [Alphaproteobacteria bacterium]|nr:ATP-binding cassette domain-containing protein [Alphaproteobacteria bacterium]